MAQSADNRKYSLVGDYTIPFLGYISALDRTNVSAQAMVMGSKNMYKKISGNISVRDGLKRRSVEDSTIAGTLASYEWNTSLATIRPLRVNNGKLEVESDILASGVYLWYTLQTGITDDIAAYIFTTLWDNTLKKDFLVFVRGDSNLFRWEGGIAKLVSTNTSDVSGLIATMVIDATGTGYAVNDVLTITGGGGSGATATVNSISGTGAITAITLTTRGSGYSATAGASTTGGGGSGATITITVATGEIGLDRDALMAGFAPTGSVIANGNTYTYGSVSGTSLLAVSPDPTGEPTDSVVLSAVITNANIPGVGFVNDWVNQVGNRLHVGSYTSRLVYISDQLNYLDYIVPTPRTPGSPELLTLDSLSKGMGVRQGEANIFGGTADLYIVSYQSITVGTTLTEQTVINKKVLANLEGLMRQEFIDNVGDDLIWLSQAQELKTYGTYRNLNDPVFPTLSLPVKTDLQATDFTGGALRAVGEFIYITAPNEGIVWLYQVRTIVNALGNVEKERLWHSPFIWSISRIAVIDSVEYGHSNANPAVYQLWNTGQWHDDGPVDTIEGPEILPYDCVLAMAYRRAGEDRDDLGNLNSVYYEGYISPGSTVNGALVLDYQGASGVLVTVINSVQSPATFFQGNVGASLGDASLGDNPLGDSLSDDDIEALPKFRASISFDAVDVFEYQLRVYSDTADARWEILCLGTNAMPSDRIAAQISK